MPFLSVPMASISSVDFFDGRESSVIALRNLRRSGCLVFQYASENLARVFQLRISTITGGTKRLLVTVIVAGMYYPSNDHFNLPVVRGEGKGNWVHVPPLNI